MLFEIVDRNQEEQDRVLMLYRVYPETSSILFVGKSRSVVQELALGSLRLR